MTTIDINQIHVYSRHREDMGDIDSLVKSIKAVGLLQPIVVTHDAMDGYRLVAGARRLEAVKRMRVTTIPAYVITNLADARDLLVAERDENTCRKDFTPSEAVALGRELEQLERPKAEARKAQAAGMPRGQKVSHGDSPQETTGKVRDIVAPMVGMASQRYGKAKTVVAAAESDPDPTVREVAKEAVKEMDVTGRVHGAFTKVKEARSNGHDKSRTAVEARKNRLIELAAEGHTTRQIAEDLGLGEERVRRIAKDADVEIIADRHVARSRRHDSTRIVEQIVMAAENVTAGVELIDFEELDPARIGEWASSLERALWSIRKFKNQLKELTRE